MKTEELDQFINRRVKVIFKDGEFEIGELGKGEYRLVTGWVGKGYHLTNLCLSNTNSLSFMKSHVKKIELNKKYYETIERIKAILKEPHPIFITDEAQEQFIKEQLEKDKKTHETIL